MRKGFIIKIFSVIFILLLILIPVLSTTSSSYTQSTPSTIDPSIYNPLNGSTFNPSEMQGLIDTVSIIVDSIRVIGIVVSVVVLLVLGIKYMVGSTSERAEYKKSMIPYFIGVAIFFGLSQILGVIITVAESL